MKNIGLMISSLNGGGAERVVSHLSHILSKKYNIHLILFETEGIGYTYCGKLHDLNVRAKNGNVFTKIDLLFKRVKKVKKIIKQEKLDCVISFLDSPNFVNLFAKISGCKTIISVRNYSALENKQSLLGNVVNNLMKVLYKRADKVVVVSKLMERDFIEHYGVSKDKICTIYNPYNFNEMQEKCQENLKQDEQKFYENHFVYINVGRIMYQKGIWHLIKAFKLVYNQDNNVRLVLVGDDHSEGKVKKLVKELGLEKAVLMTGAQKNPYKYMYCADSYVLTSMFEGFPNAMVEGMACGCAIVAANCKSGPREILCEKPDLDVEYVEIQKVDYGILVPCLETMENWEATQKTKGEEKLAEAMLMLLKDKKMAEQYANKAIERSYVFNYDECGNAYEKIIETNGSI